MNTQTIVQEQYFNPTSAGPRGPATTLIRCAYTLARGLTAITACMVLLSGSIWAVTEPGFAMYLQAFNWSSSFVFLAIAFDARKSSTALMALASGIAILLITGLSAHFGLAIALWGTLLMCAWLTLAIFKH
jgi:hypothetical protein